MTLLLTEIHNHGDPRQATIVFAADRFITVNGKFKELRKKVFTLPRHNAAFGYFGIAEAGRRPMAEWLAAHILKDRSASLQEFAESLATALDAAVPLVRRRSQISGFHICGFNNQQIEFWFVRNVDDQLHPVGLYTAREEFQRRDVPLLPPGEAMIYRNGDIQAHVQLWNVLDANLVPLLTRPDFKRVRNAVDYAKWVQFKMEVIAYVYKKWGRRPVIGRPIDVVVVTLKDGPRAI